MWYWFSFLGSTALAAWVIFFDGADELEGTIASAFLLGPLAPTVSASVLKWIAFLIWATNLCIFLVCVFR